MPFLGDPPPLGSPGHYGATKEHNRKADVTVTVDRATGSAAQDTARIQAAIDEAEARGAEAGMPAHIDIVPGNYYVETLHVRNTRPVFDGKGSIFHYRGAPGEDMWNLEHAREGVFSNLECRYSPQYPGRSAFHWWRSNAEGMILAPTKMRWDNVRIDGGGVCDFGWYTGGPGSVDANVDFGTWRDCVAMRMTKAGWRLEGTQGYGHRMDMCHALGYGTAEYGVDAYYAMFSWVGGAVAGHTVADYNIQTWGQDPYNIEGVWAIKHATSEATSGCFMVLHDSVRPFIVIEDCIFAGDNMRADGAVIVCEQTTSATLIINRMKAGKAAGNRPVHFDFDGIAENGHIELHGVHVENVNAPNPPWGSRAPDISTGVAIVDYTVSEPFAVTKVTNVP